MGYNISQDAKNSCLPKSNGRGKVLADSREPAEVIPLGIDDSDHRENNSVFCQGLTQEANRLAIEMSTDESLTQESACDRVWKDFFSKKSSFSSFQEFHETFEKYQQATFSVYRISDCNRVETANFKRKAKLNSCLRYASISFCCALVGHQKCRTKNLQNHKSQNCPSLVRLTSSSRDQQLRIVESNLLHNHRLDEESHQRFLQAKKLQQMTKDEILDALSSVQVVIREEEEEQQQEITNSSPLGDLSCGQKQYLCSDLTSGIVATLVQMESNHFHRWLSILADLLVKMELDANSEVNRERRRRPMQPNKRKTRLETCDTDKEVCNYCKKHEPPKRVCPTRVIEWIDCDSCTKWYHRACLPAIMNTKNYTCSDCLLPTSSNQDSNHIDHDK